MITCRLQGGLGNQMFQVAAASALAMELKTKVISDFNACHNAAKGFPSNKYKDTIFYLVNDKPFSENKFSSVYKKPKFSFTDLPKKDNIILDGCFQSGKYFIKYKEYFKNSFYILEEILKKVKLILVSEVGENDTITSVHVRRVDYLNLSDYHEPFDVEYYKKEMRLIGDSKFFYI